MRFEQIEILTNCGYTADERPLAFIWRGQKYLIEDTIDRWYEGNSKPGQPALNYFKVLAQDTRTYILRYNSLFDAWAIVLADEP